MRLRQLLSDKTLFDSESAGPESGSGGGIDLQRSQTPDDVMAVDAVLVWDRFVPLIPPLFPPSSFFPRILCGWPAPRASRPVVLITSLSDSIERYMDTLSMTARSWSRPISQTRTPPATKRRTSISRRRFRTALDGEYAAARPGGRSGFPDKERWQ